MPAAKLGQRGFETTVDDARCDVHRQNLGQRRPPQTIHRARFRTSSHKNRSPTPHIIAHIFKVGHRQNTPNAVAVKNDQIKFLDLFHEQFPRRKRNQRQLVHRDAILLFRRPQNGEMHQINRRIRFQQVAPNPFASMGFPRYQQHAQAVAHAVNLHHGGIVTIGQFAVCRGDRKLQDVDAAMRQGDWQLQIFARWHIKGLRSLVIYGNGHINGTHLTRGHSTLIFNAQGQHHLFAQNRKGGGVLDDKAPVPIGIIAGQQHVQRRGHVGRKFKVMHLPIGDDNRPCDPGAGFLGQGFGQGCHRKGSGVTLAVAHIHDAQLGIVHRGYFGLHCRQRLCGLVNAIPQRLAGAIIHHRNDDIRQRRAVLFLQNGVCQGGQHHCRRQPAQPPSGKTAPQGRNHHQQSRCCQRPKKWPWQKGVKDYGSGH